ncbi:hypothetical protein [Halomarina ordinaria]|uniref:Uncharacterized protein n=1 Tax=Halomarina ordinaria TaxID=3033939 RepID=A0ABD5U6Q8_9EURY|nr:hypothetical protein [Halomarina sp. PSRA2]
MPEERASPSGGWHEVYGAMAVDTDFEADSLDCPACGDDCPRLHGRTFWCPTHGTWEARSASAA